MDEVDGCSAITKGPDADNDIVCAPCLEDNIREQAVKYCQQCQEFLCLDCARHHGRLKVSRSHKLVDKDEANKALDVAMTTKCLKHPDREIEMYCREHDMVYCLKCIVTDHKSCTGVTDIEECTSLSDQTYEFVRLQTDIDNVKERLENTNRKTQTNINSAEKQKADAISQTESMERDLVDHIRMLKNRTIESLEKEYTLIEDELEANISILDKAKQRIERANCKLKVFDSLDRKHQFIESKPIQKTVNDAREVFERCDAKGCQSVLFDENTELKSSIIKSTSLGRIQRETEDNSMARTSMYMYKVKSKKEINIHMQNETKCFIIDICQLPDGTVILADHNNNIIKRLDESYNIKDYFDVGGSPTSICCTGNTEVAVRMSGNRIQFISVGSTFSKSGVHSLNYGI